MSLDINLTNVQSKPIVVSANQTAENDRVYHVVANATFTDPTGVNGKGYEVFVRNGTATINSVAYTEGTTILRLFHSGAWVSYLGGGSQNLQQVTDIGSETTNSIVSLGGFVAFDDFSSPDNYSVLNPNYLELGNNTNGEQLFLSSYDIQLIKGSTAVGKLKATNIISPNNVTLEFPNKPTGSYTIATTADIPDTSDFVEKSDFTSHSILAKQSGASDPVAVSIGNNEILGRKSGGGSNIEGLSVSEVKSLLNYTASDVGAVATNSAITGATKTKITYDAKGLVTSGADATTADIADSSNKRYVTDAQLTVIGNTSGTNTGDETQSSIFSKLGLVLFKKIGSTSVTGTTVESILHSFKVNANSLSPSDLIKIFASTLKVNTNSSYTLRIRHNTINSLSGSTQIAILSVTTLANVNVNFSRENLIIEGGNLTGFSFTTSLLSEVNTQFAGALSSTPFDVTVDNFFFLTVQLNSASDSISLRHLLLQNF
jgi:hypothetical protein